MHRFFVIMLITSIQTGLSQENPAVWVQRPLRESRVHDLGTLWTSVTNFGQFGDPSYFSPSMEWPGGSGCHYLRYGGLWIGAIRDGDTLVTQLGLGQYEWSPSENYPHEYGPGKSTLDSYVVYDDLLQLWSLGIRVHQRTLSWLDPVYDDFIAYEFTVIHVGEEKLDGVYVGWVYDYDIGAGTDPVFPGRDDIVDYDGWHSTEYETWHSLPPNLITEQGKYIDIVENLDVNGNGVLDGYDAYGLPWGDPYNPRYDPQKVFPDGYPDEWQVFLTTTGDTLVIPRNMSYMYDGDDPETGPFDAGEIGALPVDATGFAGGRLLYSDIHAHGTSVDDLYIRPASHQWWPADQSPRSEVEKYSYLSGRHPLTGVAFLRHPFDLIMPVDNYRVLQSSGPFQDFQPADTLRFVWIEAVGKGLRGLRRHMDKAMIAYYTGSLFSGPAFPSPPHQDVHWGITHPPVFGETFVDPAFVPPGFGQVLIAGKVYDENGQVSAVAAEIIFDTIPVDTLELFDDGVHGDNMAADSIYANFWPVPANREGLYTVHLLARDNEDDQSKKKQIGTFTTIGPVVVKNIIYPETDPVPSSGDSLALLISLRNNGRSAGAENVHAELSTTDSLAQIIGNQNFHLQQPLLASAEVLAEQSVVLKISKKAAHNHAIPVFAKIYSGEHLFWHDTTFVTVVDDVPPELLSLDVPRTVDFGESVPIAARFFDTAGIKSAKVYVQTPQDSTLQTLRLAHNIDDFYVADYTPELLKPADFDMDFIFEDYLGNADTVKNAAGFTNRQFKSQNSILLIDDDGYNSPGFGPAQKPYNLFYENALDSLGRLYDLYSVYFFGEPDSALLAAYSLGAVIWETGDTRLGVTDHTKVGHRDEPALTAHERSIIAGFLDKGGRLFLSGQGIGYQSEPGDFMDQYLGCSVAEKSVKSRRLQRAGHRISAGFPDVVNIRGGSGADNQMYPSGLQIESPACYPIFNYTNNGARAAVAFENNGSRVVYFGCGYEAFAEKTHRVALMQRIVDYLLQDVGVSNTPAAAGVPVDFALYQNYPNPFNASTRIKYDVSRLSRITISVHNLLGQKLNVLVDETKSPGRYSIVWQAEQQPNGVYLVNFKAAGHSRFIKVVLVR